MNFNIFKFPKKNKPFEFLTIWYILALSAIALVSVLSQLLIQNHLSNQAKDAHIINYAAKLRTYSQSLCKYALLLKEEEDFETNRKEFVNTFKQWQSLHEHLLNGSDFLNIPKNDREELKEMFKVVQAPYEEIESASSKMSDELYSRKSYKEMDLRKHIKKILANEKAYLMTMELIVFDYDRFSQNSVNQLKKIEYGLLAFVLLMLCLEAAFIFSPLSKKIREAIAVLTESKTYAVNLAEELKATNDSLESSLKELRETNFALEKATYMVKTDAEGRILYANDKYCHVTKYTMGQLIKKPLFYNSFGDQESIIYEHIRDKKRQKDVWQGEIFDQASDGTGFWLDVTLIPIIDNKGALYQYLMVSNDITKRKNTEQELQQLMKEQLKRKSIEQKIRSYSIIAGQEKERKRVAAEIHDGIGQMMTSMRILLDMLLKSRPDIQNEVGNITNLLKSIIDETRRICSNLLPSVLDDFGLKAAMVELCKNMEMQAGLNIMIEENLSAQYLDKELEIGLFRILQESLNNVVKHAQAKKVFVTINNSKEHLYLLVKDDGKGFTYAEEHLYVQDMAKKNNGLRIMKERAEMIGGKLGITSLKGEGTKIELDIAL